MPTFLPLPESGGEVLAGSTTSLLRLYCIFSSCCFALVSDSNPWVPLSGSLGLDGSQVYTKTVQRVTLHGRKEIREAVESRGQLLPFELSWSVPLNTLLIEVHIILEASH